MENNPDFHGAVIDSITYERALKELENKDNAHREEHE